MHSRSVLTIIGGMLVLVSADGLGRAAASRRNSPREIVRIIKRPFAADLAFGGYGATGARGRRLHGVDLEWRRQLATPLSRAPAIVATLRSRCGVSRRFYFRG